MIRACCPSTASASSSHWLSCCRSWGPAMQRAGGRRVGGGGRAAAAAAGGCLVDAERWCGRRHHESVQWCPPCELYQVPACVAARTLGMGCRGQLQATLMRSQCLLIKFKKQQCLELPSVRISTLAFPLCSLNHLLLVLIPHGSIVTDELHSITLDTHDLRKAVVGSLSRA